MAIQLDDVPTNSVFSEEHFGDNVKETLREMKEMMKALCEKFKTIEKCLKEIKDLQLQQRYIRFNNILHPQSHLLCIMSLLVTLMIGYARHLIKKTAML